MPAERRGAITGATPGFFSTNSSSTINNNMAFNFGSTPAPAPGGPPAPAPFSFGSPTPAPGSATAPASFSFGGSAPPSAPSGGFSFGNTPAPAPGGGGFSLGTTPAPAPGGGGFSFGNNPAPAPSTKGFSFGSNASPAPSGGMFGAPSGGSLFGSTSAPAPAGGSLFGAPAPAPGGSIYGTPAPGSFGQTSQAQAPPPALAGHMQYSAMPPDQKQAIDRLYEAMMQHKRTISHVSSMAPKLLDKPQQADAAAGTQDLPLMGRVQKLTFQVDQLQQQLQSLRQSVEYTKGLYDTSTSQAFMFAQWPTEAVAVRRGVSISKPNTNMDKDSQIKLRELLDRQATNVDRVERMPSPYLWQTLEDMEQRIHSLKGQMEALSKALESSKQIPAESADVVTIIRMQDQAIWKIASTLATVDSQVNQVRYDYRLFERGTNVIEEADQEERQHEQSLNHRLREQMVKSLPQGANKPSAPAPGGSLFSNGPGPSSGLFGTPNPAPAPFSFGGSTQAPSSGGMFGAPAPAPSGGMFGAQPASAPSGGGLFGSNPVPAPAFGAPAPAQSSGGFSFGGSGTSTLPPAPAFGATPAPANSTPAFGGFASAPTSATASTPKSKNKSRSTRRR